VQTALPCTDVKPLDSARAPSSAPLSAGVAMVAVAVASVMVAVVAMVVAAEVPLALPMPWKSNRSLRAGSSSSVP
jgi:hypothetical protein